MWFIHQESWLRTDGYHVTKALMSEKEKVSLIAFKFQQS